MEPAPSFSTLDKKKKKNEVRWPQKKFQVLESEKEKKSVEPQP